MKNKIYAALVLLGLALIPTNASAVVYKYACKGDLVGCIEGGGGSGGGGLDPGSLDPIGTAMGLVGTAVGLAGTAAALAPTCPGLPVAEGGQPNGSSWIIWMAPATSGGVWVFYLSWQLGAATLNNGADAYVAGAVVSFGADRAENVVDGPLYQAGCMRIGQFEHQAAPWPFDYMVQGGDYGQSGSAECSHTTSISGTIGIEFGVTGPAGSASITLGSSYTCGVGSVFDSEVVFGQRGSAP